LSAERLWIVGAGRLGLALGLALHRSGAFASLAYSAAAPLPRRTRCSRELPPPASYRVGLDVVPVDLAGIVLAVPDAAIAEVASALAELQVPRPLPVLHASGALSVDALAPLAERGHPVGGMHALAAIADRWREQIGCVALPLAWRGRGKHARWPSASCSRAAGAC
jgi:predicted short-subunit dehydrogenase-like oxidoreductase (DUF2520 family)